MSLSELLSKEREDKEKIIQISLEKFDELTGTLIESHVIDFLKQLHDFIQGRNPIEISYLTKFPSEVLARLQKLPDNCPDYLIIVREPKWQDYIYKLPLAVARLSYNFRTGYIRTGMYGGYDNVWKHDVLSAQCLEKGHLELVAGTVPKSWGEDDEIIFLDENECRDIGRVDQALGKLFQK